MSIIFLLLYLEKIACLLIAECIKFLKKMFRVSRGIVLSTAGKDQLTAQIFI